MKTNIKLWTMGLMTAALLGNTACTDLLHESYGQVVSEACRKRRKMSVIW